MAINQNDYKPVQWKVGDYLTAKQMTDVSTVLDAVENFVRDQDARLNRIVNVDTPITEVVSIAVDHAVETAVNRAIEKVIAQHPHAVEALAKIGEALANGDALATKLATDITANQNAIREVDAKAKSNATALATKVSVDDFEAFQEEARKGLEDVNNLLDKDIEDLVSRLEEHLNASSQIYATQANVTDAIENCKIELQQWTSDELTKLNNAIIVTIHNSIQPHLDTINNSINTNTASINSINEELALHSERIDTKVDQSEFDATKQELKQSCDEVAERLEGEIESLHDTHNTHHEEVSTQVGRNAENITRIGEYINGKLKEELNKRATNEQLAATDEQLAAAKVVIDEHGNAIEALQNDVATKADNAEFEAYRNNVDAKLQQTFNDMVYLNQTAASHQSEIINLQAKTNTLQSTKVDIDVYNSKVEELRADYNKQISEEQVRVNGEVERLNGVIGTKADTDNVNNTFAEIRASIQTAESVAAKANDDLEQRLLDNIAGHEQASTIRFEAVEGSVQQLDQQAAAYREAHEAQYTAVVKRVAQLEQHTADYDIEGKATEYIANVAQATTTAAIQNLVGDASEAFDTLSEISKTLEEQPALHEALRAMSTENSALIAENKTSITQLADSLVSAKSKLTTDINTVNNTLTSSVKKVTARVDAAENHLKTAESDIVALKASATLANTDIQNAVKKHEEELAHAVNVINSDLEVIRGSHATDVATLTSTINQTNQQFVTSIDNLRAETTTSINSVNTTLTEKIDNVAAESAAALETAKTELSKNFNDALAGEISRVEIVHASDVDTLRGEITSNVSEASKKASDDLAAAVSDITASIEELTLSQDNNVGSVKAELLDKIVEEKSELVGKIDGVSQALADNAAADAQAREQLQANIDAKTDQVEFDQLAQRVDQLDQDKATKAELAELVADHHDDVAILDGKILSEVAAAKADAASKITALSGKFGEFKVATEHANELHLEQYANLVTVVTGKASKDELASAIANERAQTNSQINTCANRQEFNDFRTSTLTTTDAIKSDLNKHTLDIASLQSADAAMSVKVDGVIASVEAANAEIDTKADLTLVSQVHDDIRADIANNQIANNAAQETIRQEVATLSGTVGSNRAVFDQFVTDQLVLHAGITNTLQAKADKADVDSQVQTINSDIAALRTIVDITKPISNALTETVDTAVKTAVDQVVANAPGTMDTLKDISDAFQASGVEVKSILDAYSETMAKVKQEHADDMKAVDERFDKVELQATGLATKDQLAAEVATINAKFDKQAADVTALTDVVATKATAANLEKTNNKVEELGARVSVAEHAIQANKASCDERLQTLNETLKTKLSAADISHLATINYVDNQIHHVDEMKVNQQEFDTHVNEIKFQRIEDEKTFTTFIEGNATEHGEIRSQLAELDSNIKAISNSHLSDVVVLSNQHNELRDAIFGTEQAEGELAKLEAKDEVLEGNIAVLNGDVAQLRADVAEVQQHVTSAEELIEGLIEANNVEYVDVKHNELNAKINKINTTLDEYNNAHNEYSEVLAAHDERLNNIEPRLTTVELVAASNSDAITNLTNNVGIYYGDHAKKIAALESKDAEYRVELDEMFETVSTNATDTDMRCYAIEERLDTAETKHAVLNDTVTNLANNVEELADKQQQHEQVFETAYAELNTQLNNAGNAYLAKFKNIDNIIDGIKETKADLAYVDSKLQVANQTLDDAIKTEIADREAADKVLSDRIDQHDEWIGKAEQNFTTISTAVELKFKEIDGRLTDRQESIDALSATHAADVEQIETRFETVESNVNTHFEAVESNVAELANKHQQHVDEYNAAYAELNTQLNNAGNAYLAKFKNIDSNIDGLRETKADQAYVDGKFEVIDQTFAGLFEGSDSKLDSLRELVVAFNEADASLSEIINRAVTNNADAIDETNVRVTELANKHQQHVDEYNVAYAELNTQLNNAGNAYLAKFKNIDNIIDGVKETKADQTYVDGKIAAVNTAVSNNANAIKAEATNRETADNALGQRIDELSDKHQQHIDEYNAAYTELNTQLNNAGNAYLAKFKNIDNLIDGIKETKADLAYVDGKFSTIETSIETEVSTREGADSALSQRIDELNGKHEQHIDEYNAAYAELNTQLNNAGNAYLAKFKNIDNVIDNVKETKADLAYVDGELNTKADLNALNSHVIDFNQFKSMYEDVIAEMKAEIAQLRNYVRELQGKVDGAEQLKDTTPVVLESVFSTDMVAQSNSATKKAVGNLTIECGMLMNQSNDETKETTYNFVSNVGDVTIGDMTVSDSILNVTAGPMLDQINADQNYNDATTVVKKVTAETMPSKSNVDKDGNWTSSHATKIVENDLVVDGGALTRQDEVETHETTYNFKSTSGSATFNNITVNDSIMNVTAGPALGA